MKEIDRETERQRDRERERERERECVCVSMMIKHVHGSHTVLFAANEIGREACRQAQAPLSFLKVE
jgi:hypothetical protein